MRSISRRTRSKVRSFTLLEILICLALVVSLSALFAFEGKKLFDAYRFESSVRLLKSEWEKTRVQSLIYRTDIELVLLEKGSDLYLQKKCDEPIFSRCKMVSLPGINEMRSQGKKKKKLGIAKFSKGYCVSAETIELCSNRKEIVWNCLREPSDMGKKSL